MRSLGYDPKSAGLSNAASKAAAKALALQMSNNQEPSLGATTNLIIKSLEQTTPHQHLHQQASKKQSKKKSMPPKLKLHQL